MKKVSVKIVNGKITIDFEGFVGRECSNEEDKMKALFGALGIETEVKYSDNKEAESESVSEREKNRN